MKKIGLISLGCAKNLVDSEMILAMFDKGKYQITDHPEEADLIIVNTCGFIASAKQESIETILEMSQHKAKIAVVGCLAERYYDELKKSLPEADLICPIANYGGLPKALSELLDEDSSSIKELDPLDRVLSTPSFSAYLRISEGCDNFCSFCAIPFIRGRFKSRPYEEILKEAKALKEKGIKEISIVSQDTASYGKEFPNRHPDIHDLLKELDSMGFYSIRLLYLYPDELDESFIDLVANSHSIKHYFDIPIQCASDHLLRRMNRHGSKKQMEDLFSLIREKCPDAILRTTLISGFPGENEEDQRETIEFLNKVRFDHLGVFAYSKEEGTAAARMKEQLPEEVKNARRDELMSLQRKISYANNKSHIGEVMEGLVIGREKKNEYLLRSSWNAPDGIDGNIYFASTRELHNGDIVKVKITSAFVYDLRGVEESQ